jgi:predicted esterase
LPALGGNPNTITLSGFEGGAIMADHMMIIYSTTFQGAGLMIGAPYKIF